MTAKADRSYSSKPARRRAAMLVVAMVVLLVLTMLGAELVRTMVIAHRGRQTYDRETQALTLAEAGLSRAQAQLQASANYQGETWQPRIPNADGSSEDAARARVTIVIETVDTGRLVRVEAIYPDHPTDRALIKRSHQLPPAQEAAP